LLKEHFKPITPDTILNEMDRYFQSEIRYMRVEEENRIKNAANALIAQIMGSQLANQWQKEGKINIDIKELTPGN
jgi:hypothetical protein